MIIYYSPTILTDNGFSTTTALRVSVGLGVTYLVIQIIGVPSSTGSTVGA